MDPMPPPSAVLIGGSSEIGSAIIRELAAERSLRVALVGRHHLRLIAAADALRQPDRLEVSVHDSDFADVEATERALDEAWAAHGPPEIVIVAVGALGGQGGLDADPREIADVLDSTFAVTGRVLIGAARRLRDRGSGTLVVLSSVAGVRIRASNAAYGAAKAGLDALVSGVRDQLAETEVRVLVVRPGFVVGRMTAGLAAAPFSTSARAVARATVNGLAGGGDTIWVPRVLRWVFLGLRLLPRGVWRRLPW